MPDSGTISSMAPSHHSQQPPFYSPPAPPPSHHNHHGGGDDNGEGGGSYHHHHHLNYNGDNNGNSNMNSDNNGGGGDYSRGGGGRTVSFIGGNNNSNNSNNNNNGNSNNPNDPNNNSGMMIMMEDDGGGGGVGGDNSMLMLNSSDIHNNHPHHHQQQLQQRDLFEEIRNGGGHWSQLLRQVVLTPPPPSPNSVLDDYSPSTPTSTSGGGVGGGGGNSESKDDPMMGDGGGGGNGDTNSGSATNGDGGDNSGGGGQGSSSSSGMVPLQIVGGSENGQFVYVGITNQDINRWITVGYLQPGDIILEIQGQQVAGYTQSDVISLLHHCLRGNSATLTVAPRGSLGPELRSYLNTRFQKGSVDHALQGVVRDNLYLRTVPVTTRSPRPGEINGVDYTFLSVEEFMQLERDGSLLESGVYAGNHYGTPKPWARLTRGVIGGGAGGGDMMMMEQYGGGGGMEGLMNHNSMVMMMEGGSSSGGGGGGAPSKGPLLPGMHPSSEGKRRRNRSNVEALGAGGGDEDGSGNNGGGGSGGVPPPLQSPPGGRQGDGGGVELGPLPANWEMAYTDNGEVYFIDHNTGTSHWLDPRLSRVQKLSLEECTEDELPFGWERIEDPHYGVYYIDHVNRRTQFENPVIQAKQQQQTQDGGSPSKGGGLDRNGNNGMSTDSEADSTSKFLPNEQQPPPHPHHHHQPPPMQYPPQPPSHHLQKRPTSLAKPVPPVPNPKPQNPNRLSISQHQRTKTPVNDMMDQSHYLQGDNGGGGGGGGSLLPAFPSSSSAGSSGGLKVKPVHHDNHHHNRPSYRFFTRDPSQLIGERIVTTLVKSNRGLGFTIVGGDDDDGLDEFLQIKSVVSDGPACIDGRLRTGDVLVKVNGTCVLGYTHQEMVSIFQSISPGQDVQLEVCRGYPLPFDPADPNTEIVTTVAVAPLDPNGGGDPSQFHSHPHHHHHQKKHVDWARPGTPDSLTHSAHSLPELSNNDRLVDFGVGVGGGKSGGGHRPASVDLLMDSPKGQLRYPGGMFLGTGGQNQDVTAAAVLIVNIVKGNQGFGFTIADSVTGQKVKKVLDQSHCGELEEGDRLIALDGLDLRGLSHTQVVQILKDFPVGREASLTIQRTPPNSPYNSGGGSGGGHTARFFGGGGFMDSVPRILPPPTRPPGISPRSKTPTAELARGRPRMRDNLPERPKTPQGLLGDGGSGRGDYNGLFNGGDGPPQLFNHHQFLAERLGNQANGNGGGDGGVGGMTPTSGGGGGGDLNNLPVVRDWMEMTIELQRRQEGFGFRIVGGTEEGSQVSVGHIVPGGAAALDGRLCTGDQLIAVEGISVIGASHRSVVQLMARSATQGKVRLTVRRPVYGGGGMASNSDTATTAVVTPIHSPGGGGGSIAGGSIGSQTTSSQPIHVTLRRQPSEGFGFVIISSASKAGATIGKIVESSPADRCGELHVGDRILAVNQLDISQLHHTQVVQLIKESGFVLTLSVLPVILGGTLTPTTPTSGGPPPMSSPGGGGGGGGPQQGSHLQQNMQQQLHNLHHQLHGGGGGGMQDGMENLSLRDGSQAGDMGTAFISPEGHTIHFGSNHSAASSYPGDNGGGHEQVFSVHLSRGNRGFGFSIRGGKEFQNMPLFVLRLAEDGPAAMDGRMQVGDQILQINGINTHGMTHAQAIHLIKTGGVSVHLLLRRGTVPFPFLNQMPNLTSGGFGSTNGQEVEEQSLSNASNNNSVEQQFISQSQNAAAMYRDHHHHHAGF